MGSVSDDSGAPLYVRRSPFPALAGFVSGIYAYAEHGERLSGVVECASLTVPLIINFGATFEIALGRPPVAGDDYASFAAGLFAGPVHMNSTGGAQCVQVNFTPIGGRLFFGLPMSELADRMVPLDNLGDRDIGQLARELADFNDWDSRLDRVEAFVEHRLGRAQEADRALADPSVVWAYRRLEARHGDVRIGALARHLDWSRRRLVERFRADIGLPPKAVARIIRFNAALGLANGASDPDWADIAAACGYADQAHLVREFGALAGQPPAAWCAAA